MRNSTWSLCCLLVLAMVFPGLSSAFTVFPFQGLGPETEMANGLQYHWVYQTGQFLFLTTEEGFLSYDYDAEAWVDHTWPGWIGRSITAVVPVPGHQDRLALGGVNGWFKGVLKLSEDAGATDEVVYESEGGRVKEMALATFPDTAIFACTWSDIADGELLRSDDGGLSYDLLPGHGHHAMTGVKALTSEEIYVCGDNYLTRSLDGGQTWENLQGNLPDGLGLYCLLAPPPISALPGGRPFPPGRDDPEITASFLMVSNDNGVYLSDARNIDWQLVLPFSCRALSFNFRQYDTFIFWSEFYAVTFDGRLLANLDGNWDNWKDITAMIAPAEPLDLAETLGAVYVLSRNDGVFVSSGIDGLSPVLPDAPGLTLSARPNPFNPATELVFNVPRTGHAVIEIFDLAGRRVDEVFAGEIEAGSHTLTWQPRRLGSGVYHAVLRQDGKRVVKRVSLIK